MKQKRWYLGVLLLVLLALLYLHYRQRQGGSPLAAGALVPYATQRDNSVIDGEVLLDLDDDVNEAELNQLQRRYGLRLRLNSRFSRGPRLYRATVADGRITRLLQRLRVDPSIENAERDTIYGIPPLERGLTPPDAVDGTDVNSPGFPNDPRYRHQWHLDQIGMRRAWPTGQGRGVIVAVIDTGVAFKDQGRFKAVPDLAGTEFVQGYDFVNDDEDALDDHGHGTHVAGTIAQTTHNKIGVAGIAFAAKIMPLKVLSARGFGSVADIAEAVRFAADHGAKVVNLSLGGSRSSRILAAAIKYACGKGVLVVCAAGNDGRGRVSYPAADPGALAVAATQFDRTTTFYSNWGPAIDLAAPGGNTRVDQNGDGVPDGVLQNTIIPGHPEQNDYLLFMGTSMAAPHVAGAAALLIGNGISDPPAVAKVLTDTANHPAGVNRDDHYGAGIVDAGAALNQTQVVWGSYKVVLSALLALLLMLRLRSRAQLGIRPGPMMLMGLLLGSAGLFFLPALLSTAGLSLPPGLALLTRGMPRWDLALNTSANPLFHSLLLPLGFCALLLHRRRLRGLLFGLSIGVAAHLIFVALVACTDVLWIPNVLGLDTLWLWINALGCLALADLVARPR